MHAITGKIGDDVLVMGYDLNVAIGARQSVSAQADSVSRTVNLLAGINGLLAKNKLWRFQSCVGGVSL